LKKKKIIVVMPAYNAARTLPDVFEQIPKGIVDKVLLVDDASKDNTVEIAKELGLEVIVHKKNKGYGGNQKSCYDYALKWGADYVIMLHPDGQYDPQDLPVFIKALESGSSDMILGSRFLGKRHQTPLYKTVSIKFITMLFNLVLKTKLTEANTGYRGYTRKFLEKIPYHQNGNGYIFDPQFIIQAVFFGFKIKEVSVSKDYLKEASSPNFKTSLIHGFENLKLLTEYLLHRSNLNKFPYLTA
jgi:glycosyltransferase involved in cell wall biosynthesis